MMKLFAPLAALALSLTPTVTADAEDFAPAPEFTSSSPADWINSEPLKISDLAGSVVLLDVWTFDCWNCYRSIPWLLSLEERFGEQGFRIVGIHSPEFKHERKRDNVEARVEHFGIEHPVMMDNDFAYWRALDNRYWPAFYLIDRQGRLRAHFVGETHAGDKRATRASRQSHCPS